MSEEITIINGCTECDLVDHSKLAKCSHPDAPYHMYLDYHHSRNYPVWCPLLHKPFKGIEVNKDWRNK